jgi:hypothetical protein
MVLKKPIAFGSARRIDDLAGYTSAGRRTARRVSTRCRVTRYAPCDVCGANRANPRRPIVSHNSERIFEAELYRLKARALSMRGAPDAEAARCCE